MWMTVLNCQVWSVIEDYLYPKSTGVAPYTTLPWLHGMSLFYTQKSNICLSSSYHSSENTFVTGEDILTSNLSAPNQPL